MVERSKDDLITFRILQSVVVLPCVAYLVWRLWWVVVFPADNHPYVRMALAGVAALVPASMWLRDWNKGGVAGRFVRLVRIGTQALAAGTALLCAAWAGWLFTSPYSGPMSAEATFISLFLALAGFIVSFLIALEPVVLDPWLEHMGEYCKRVVKLFAILLPLGWTVGLVWGHPMAVAVGLAPN